jgi:hemoglobin-like flavoprotein
MEGSELMVAPTQEPRVWPTTQELSDAALLKPSLERIGPRGKLLVADFYRRLFLRDPTLRALFRPNMADQHDALLSAIVGLVRHYADPEVLVPVLSDMGVKHARFGLSILEYTTVGEVLIETLEDFEGENFTMDLRKAWLRAYTFASGIMMASGVTGVHLRPVAG